MYHGLLQHALQLADIAGPRIVQQHVQCVGGDAVHVLAELLAEAPQEPFEQQQNVFAALAQGGILILNPFNR